MTASPPEPQRPIPASELIDYLKGGRLRGHFRNDYKLTFTQFLTLEIQRSPQLLVERNDPTRAPLGD